MKRQPVSQRIRGERRSMFDKIWDSHVVLARDGGPSLIYIDRDMVHEGSRSRYSAPPIITHRLPGAVLRMPRRRRSAR
jgi:hypothetical protein